LKRGKTPHLSLNTFRTVRHWKIIKFGSIQGIRFGTAERAYSTVTARENKDSQITLTDYEAELFVSNFGEENILTGNSEATGKGSSIDIIP
jgi:hypothetical protein